MTDSEIIKALERCGTTRLREQDGDVSPCTDCPMQNCEDCEVELPDCALDLIKRQKAEIERMEKRLDMSRKELSRRRERNIQNSDLNLKLLSELKIVKSEAIREFAARLKVKAAWDDRDNTVVHLDDIDSIVKEMTEVS